MGLRRDARELALQVLFQVGFGADRMAVLGGFWQEHNASPSLQAYAEQLVTRVFAHWEEIDEMIGRYAEHWALDRIALVDRNILRVSICELLYFKEVPPQVVIDEAIEIAKKYGSENSGAFVNGLLDRVHREASPPLPDG